VGSQRVGAGQQLSLIGRDQPEIRGALDDARRGEGHLFDIVGEAGVG
jgi:hypothetical protein